MKIRLLILVGFAFLFLLAKAVTPILAGGPPIDYSISCPYTGTLDKATYPANQVCNMQINVYSDFGSSAPCPNCNISISWSNPEGAYFQQSSNTTDQNGKVSAEFASYTTGWRTFVISTTLPDGRTVSTEDPMFFLVLNNNPDYLPAPTILNNSCSNNGKLARFSWNQITGADKYLVRVNKEPIEIWNPADKSSGDYARLVRGGNKLSHLDQVVPYSSYKWSVQTLRAGEEYSPHGNLSPWISFTCLPH